MKFRIIAFVVLALAAGSAALAQRLPSYYPGSFQRTGTVDDIQKDAIVINDILYMFSESLVLHTLSEVEAPIARLLGGETVAYSLDENSRLVEIWVLPAGYGIGRVRR